MPQIEYAMIARPLPGEASCGDMPWIKKFENKILFCLIDVAGHGPSAEMQAKICQQVLEEHYHDDLKQIISKLNECARGKRALVVGLTLIDIKTGLIDYLSVGNINTRIIGEKCYRFVARTGILNGVNPPHLYLANHSLNNHDVLLMYSDGISNHFETSNYPEILNDKIDLVANEIVSRFGKDTDDASCIAIRYLL